jgi:protein SCO1
VTTVHQAPRGPLTPARGKGTRYLYIATIAFSLLSLLVAATAHADDSDDSERRAIEFSQAAIGRTVSDMAFIDASGVERRLSDYRGKPLLVSMVFTACAHACSVTTRHIDRSVRVARDALGPDSFNTVTIGFDTPVDTPEAMRNYARRHGVNDVRWQFLSNGDAGAMRRLTDELGFTLQPSPRGFDHTVQLSLLDGEGVVYRQVYGEQFNLPLLVEPLKDLVLGRPSAEDSMFTRLGNRVRLFCTVYDPKGDRYLFDYSLFAGIFIGVLVLGSTLLWLLLEIRSGRRSRLAS